MPPFSDALADPARLQAVRNTELLDSPSDPAFDRITRLAARLLETPAAFVNLLDDRRQFTKSCFAPSTWPKIYDTPIEQSLCTVPVATCAPFRIDDVRSGAKALPPLAPPWSRIEAYLGVPLLAPGGHALGTLCVAMFEPRRWTDEHVALLRDLAALVSTEIELRAELRAHESRNQLMLEAKEEAERANRAKTEFVSRMSHELRTPLNAILGFGQLLEMEIGSDGDRESVEQILRAGQHLLGLVDDVLDIARIEAGRVTISIEPVPLREILVESWALVRGMAADRNVAFELALGDHTRLMVWADEQRLKQVLLNLFSNAIKYNRDGGTIAVSCEEFAAGSLRVSVADTGMGISRRNLHRLFIPFERLDAARGGVDGTGLGLVLSKGLVEAMGGSFGAESEEGRGSTFWFELPCVDLDQAGVSRKAHVSEARAGYTILLVEDNLANSRLIAHVLQRRGDVRLITAMQGSRGLELARLHEPDAIILDLNLPDIHGHAILAELKQDLKLRTIPVIMISGGARGSDVELSLSLGAAAFLMKPFDLKEFTRAVDESLGGTA